MKIDYFKDTFTYFKTLCSDISNKTLLDFGCNYGSFLESSNGAFDQTMYTGIDVDNAALLSGKKMFPQATFIHSDQHNHMYNHGGDSSRPDIGCFDNIISYSVFTHTTLHDFVANLDWLYTKLHVGGKIMCTYLNVDHSSTVRYFYNKRIKDFGSCDTISTDTFTYLIDNKISMSETNSNFFLLFLNNSFLSSLLAEKGYCFRLVDDIPARNCFQSCIVIDKLQ